MGNQFRIAVLKRGLKVGRNVLGRLEMVLRPPRQCFHLIHEFLLKAAGQVLGLADVGLLRTFIATGQQDDQRRSSPDEIEPVARPVIDSQLENTASDGSHVSRIAKAKAVDPHLNSRSCLSISQVPEPGREGFGLPNFDQR